MKKLLQIILIFIILTTPVLSVFAEPSGVTSQPEASSEVSPAPTPEPAPLPTLEADACILIDAKSGEVLFERNADRPRLYPASTTKIMTALLAIEKGNMDQIMVASEAAVNDIGKDGMNIGIMAGEELRLEKLLEALLIRSANETANIIAENLSSTRQEFVDLMNERARELGATGTHFVNPCGAHDSEHYTTAADLAKISRHAMTLPKFREMVAKTSFLMEPTNKHDSWPVLATTNNLLKKYNKSELYTVNGIKTGYTVPSGHCLISSAVNADGMELITVVLGVRNEGSKDNVIKLTKQLFEYGFTRFSRVTLQMGNETVDQIPVEDAEDKNPLAVVTKGTLEYVLPTDPTQWNVVKKLHLRSPIQAPVNQGDLLGYLEYERNGSSIGRVDVVAGRSIKRMPQAEIIHTAQIVSRNPLLRNILIVTLITVAVFIPLRMVLRRISRRINSRRY